MFLAVRRRIKIGPEVDVNILLDSVESEPESEAGHEVSSGSDKENSPVKIGEY